VHGDLIAANVLVDDAHRPSAVLDFGFLTAVGDPAFDVAVTSSVHDMYGPHARTTEERLEAVFADRFDHDPARLDVHRAAYALVTATSFGAGGEDGHFAWCVAVLRRPRVRRALGL
jgi:aminoglycoside phosphotransferase (APT) family kinase protein